MVADSFEKSLIEIVSASPRCMQTFEVARKLELPDWAIGAGLIRATVWDRLSGYTVPTPVDDIDLIHFSPHRLDPRFDVDLEELLNFNNPGIPWNVRNQARMHLNNGDPPYQSTDHALQFWLETPTCIALQWKSNGAFSVIAPFGLEDLFSMTIRPTPRGRERAAAYCKRVKSKRWQLK
jgi:uncharacterized protein